MKKYVIGIDEAGRGPLAGPVAVGVCRFEMGAYKKYLRLRPLTRVPEVKSSVFELQNKSETEAMQKHRRGRDEVLETKNELLGQGRGSGWSLTTKNRLPVGIDSKKLSEEKREYWFAEILKMEEKGELVWAVGFSSGKIIDEKGIVFAIQSAMKNALTKIGADEAESKVLLDGGLKPPLEFTDFQTIIKGDEKEVVIGLASICAKVLRDREMKKLGKKYPQYEFEIHKGYGTKKHRENIQKHGISKEHRKSFLKNLYK